MADKKLIQEFIEGLLILEPYDQGGFSLQAEHDELFCGVDSEVSAEDKEKLKGLGWRHDRDDETLWSKFT